jgi:prophage maintenance system killer protein
MSRPPAAVSAQARDLLFLHARLAETLGTARGLADPGRLRTALTTIEGLSPAANLFERAATSARALDAARPFHAANRALAIAAAAMFLRTYELDVQLVPAEMPTLANALTAPDADALVVWLRAHTVPLPL